MFKRRRKLCGLGYDKLINHGLSRGITLKNKIEPNANFKVKISAYENFIFGFHKEYFRLIFR